MLDNVNVNDYWWLVKDKIFKMFPLFVLQWGDLKRLSIQLDIICNLRCVQRHAVVRWFCDCVSILNHKPHVRLTSCLQGPGKAKMKQAIDFFNVLKYHSYNHNNLCFPVFFIFLQITNKQFNICYIFSKSREHLVRHHIVVWCSSYIESNKHSPLLSSKNICIMFPLPHSICCIIIFLGTCSKSLGTDTCPCIGENGSM